LASSPRDLVCADANDATRIISEIVKTMLGIVHLIIGTLLTAIEIPFLRFNGEVDILQRLLVSIPTLHLSCEPL
jgi:hypothetical protein